MGDDIDLFDYNPGMPILANALAGQWYVVDNAVGNRMFTNAYQNVTLHYPPKPQEPAIMQEWDDV